MKKIFLLTTLIGISCANSVGQNSTSLDKLITHIQAYLDKMPALQSRVILNQQKYYIQDTVFFKAYFLDVNQAPIKGKAFMNLVLTDYSGKNLKQISFTVKDGIGFSQLVLPDSITPGKYRVA